MARQWQIQDGIIIPALLDWWMQIGVQASAAEHGVLKSYYLTNALSTIKLLQQVGTNAVILTADNYVTTGQKTYNGVQLMNADPPVWGAIVSFFTTNGDFDSEVIMTPGAVTNGTYVGVGALVISDTTFGALVGGFNGGYAYNFPDNTFGYNNSPYLTVDYAPDDSVTLFYMDTSPQYSSSPGNLVDGAATTWDLLEASSAISSGQVQLDPSLASTYASLAAEFGVGQNAGSAYNQLYNYGTVSTQPSTYNDGSQRVSDPVNMMTGEFYVDSPDITLARPHAVANPPQLWEPKSCGKRIWLRLANERYAVLECRHKFHSHLRHRNGRHDGGLSANPHQRQFLAATAPGQPNAQQ